MYKLVFEKDIKKQLGNVPEHLRFRSVKRAELYIVERYGSGALNTLQGFNILIVEDKGNNKDEWLKTSVPRIKQAVADLRKYKKEVGLK